MHTCTYTKMDHSKAARHHQPPSYISTASSMHTYAHALMHKRTFVCVASRTCVSTRDSLRIYRYTTEHRETPPYIRPPFFCLMDLKLPSLAKHHLCLCVAIFCNLPKIQTSQTKRWFCSQTRIFDTTLNPETVGVRSSYCVQVFFMCLGFVVCEFC